MRLSGCCCWRLSRTICLVSDSHFGAAFWMGIFRAPPLSDGHWEEAVRVWAEPGPSPHVMGSWRGSWQWWWWWEGGRGRGIGVPS